MSRSKQRQEGKVRFRYVLSQIIKDQLLILVTSRSTQRQERKFSFRYVLSQIIKDSLLILVTSKSKQRQEGKVRFRQVLSQIIKDYLLILPRSNHGRVTLCLSNARDRPFITGFILASQDKLLTPEIIFCLQQKGKQLLKKKHVQN